MKFFLALSVFLTFTTAAYSAENSALSPPSPAAQKPGTEKAAADVGSGSVAIDPKLPKYEKTSGEVSGEIKSIGSDTMVLLMQGWAQGFHGLYPGVNASVEGKGSSTAPPALINGTANFGPMSRDWKASEIDDFE